ncbi:Zeatin O-xylosyltransferase [Camellia lanceoleosa]|uniref:Zeatin O-xylosyltransferase n=1 Tax=Camellia lanceoleosa TaxID=1840588 RepID=A0ACC0G7L6_9ERIC|nr:Zeatin O-xylosyltransferase [Camellia lanceoleosa]
MVPGQVLLASLNAVNKVLDAAEVVEKQALSDTSATTTRMVSERWQMMGKPFQVDEPQGLLSDEGCVPSEIQSLLNLQTDFLKSTSRAIINSCRSIEDILKASVPVKEWAELQEWVVASSTIAEAVKKLMASREGEEMRKRAEELGGATRKAVEKGGVSRMELDLFIAHITR